MMNECKRGESLVQAWEEGVPPSSEDLSFLKNHSSACRRCGPRYVRILPLMCRDSGEPGEKVPTARARAVADGVMEAILGGGAAAPRPSIQLVSHRAPSGMRKSFLAIAAAAAAVLALLWWVPTIARGDAKVVVRFVVAEPGARSVNLVGDFTGWKGMGYSMHPDNSGRIWEVDVPLEKGKVYLYNFVIDQTKWTVDPAAIEKVDDGFGGTSALLRL